MRTEPDTLVVLFVQFAVLSLFAIGGASTVVPEMQRQMVELRGWLSDRQFSELYAIAQATPGPNVMFVALLGHFIAGAPGAIVTTAAMCGPTCFLAYGVSRVFERFRAARLTMAIQAGLVPGHDRINCVQRADYRTRLRSRLERLRGHRGDFCARHLDADFAADRARRRRGPRPCGLCPLTAIWATAAQRMLLASLRLVLGIAPGHKRAETRGTSAAGRVC